MCSNKLDKMYRSDSAANTAAHSPSSRWSFSSAWAHRRRANTWAAYSSFSSHARPNGSSSSPSSSSDSSSSTPTSSAWDNWWCNSCRRPREECECMCTVS